MEFKADIHDAVKVEAFNAMAKVWGSGDSFFRKAEAIATILEDAIKMTEGK